MTSLVLGLLGTAAAIEPDAGPGGEVEFEIRQGVRNQRVSSQVSPGIIGFQQTIGITAEARFRLSTSNARFGLEMSGAFDGLTAAFGFRGERWGGVRAVVGGRGHSPLVDTAGCAKLGLTTVDLRFLGDDGHTPQTAGTLGAELRRTNAGRMQFLEGEVLLGPSVIGGSVRAAIGFGIGDTGWFATVGASTSRIQDFPHVPERDVVQATQQIETSMGGIL